MRIVYIESRKQIKTGKKPLYVNQKLNYRFFNNRSYIDYV